MYETSCEFLVFCLIAAHPEMGFPDSRYQSFESLKTLSKVEGLSAFSDQQKPGRQRV